MLSSSPGTLHMLFPLPRTLFLPSSALGFSLSNVHHSRLTREAANEFPQKQLMLIPASRVPPSWTVTLRSHDNSPADRSVCRL